MVVIFAYCSVIYYTSCLIIPSTLFPYGLQTALSQFLPNSPRFTSFRQKANKQTNKKKTSKIVTHRRRSLRVTKQSDLGPYSGPRAQFLPYRPLGG